MPAASSFGSRLSATNDVAFRSFRAAAGWAAAALL